MSLFSFVKEAGEKLIDLLTPGNANAEEQLKNTWKLSAWATPTSRPL